MSEPIEGEIVNRPPPVRFTKYPEETVAALEAAFNNGYNITEACHYADISRTTFYEWLAGDDNFSYRMSVAQGMLNRKAKENVVEAIKSGDPNISLRYLTLRDPDYKPKAALDVDPNTERVENKLKEFMDDTDDGAYPDAATADAERSEPAAAAEPEGGGEVAQSPPDIP